MAWTVLNGEAATGFCCMSLLQGVSILIFVTRCTKCHVPGIKDNNYKRIRRNFTNHRFENRMSPGIKNHCKIFSH